MTLIEKINGFVNAVANDIKSLYANKVNKTDVIAVAQGGTGATDAATARDNLGVDYVGGRNLWLDSAFFVAKILGAGSVAKSTNGVTYTNASDYVYFGNPLSVKTLDIDSYYTLTIKYQIISGEDSGFQWFINESNGYIHIPTIILSNGWRIAKLTRKIAFDSSINMHFFIPSGQVEIAWAKLEKGSITTDWTPAPEDLALGNTTNISIASIKSGQASYAKGWRKLTATLPSQAGEITKAHGVTTVETVQAKATNSDGIIVNNNDIDPANQFYVRVNGANLVLGVTANSTKVFGQSVTIYVGEEL